MRKYLLVSLIGLVAVLGASCLVPPATDSKTGTKYDTSQDVRIAALEGIVQGPNGLQALVGQHTTKLNNVADTSGLSSRISSAEARLSTVEGKVGAGTGSGVTQAQIDALSARIKTLEDWKAGSGSSGGGSTPAPGGAISTHGNLQLILERSVEEEVWLDDNVQQTWRLTVRNTGTSPTYFRINAYFDCEESIAVTSASLVPDFSASSGVQCTPTSVGAGTYSSLPFLFTSTGTSNKVYIGKQRDESLFLTFKVNYASAVGKRWTWDFSIREVN